MILIGDVHGKFGSYKNIIKQYSNTIQVGDMGVGFKRREDIAEAFNLNLYHPNPPYDIMVNGNHRFIRGNHDNPSVCSRHSQCITDGHIENDMMFIGGALSIDRAFRTEGYDWWEDEELSIKELDLLIDKIVDEKPRVMITHTAPDFLSDELAWAANRGYKLDFPSRTQQAFNSMFYHHKPEIHIFGHWHVDFDYFHEDTRFICLNELSTFELDMDNLMGNEIISYEKFLANKS